MQSNAQTPDQYLDELPEDRKIAISNLRKVILENLPEGFQETMSYGMIGYVVPHSLYPSGYHCTPNLPLPFLSIASQKNFIAVYHMLVYSEPTINEWFVNEFPKHSKAKLDMGKSCIRFKKLDQIPFELIGELASKVTVDEWIKIYEAQLKR
ncbi:DUF1801 domain-containing protein [Arcicella sp. DC2W]|uniref:DUF1801 domain-containing protein n=1 Tax=Arcicella gelida TaxID=2984195 RepID=A0ABU5SCV4_9BACT|nr:DUF1801 domain-containing protein [Arcicella sp. DC2W]MEA5406023.1 DUF1801 domain-containing protein [Arcicella sp. DC2W]